MTPIQTLKHHNEWRRGSDTEMLNPTELGKAIDTVVADFEALQKQNNELRAKVEALESIVNGTAPAPSNVIRNYKPEVSIHLKQSLADIRAEAVMDLANNWIVNFDHDYDTRKKIINHANRIKEG